MTEADFQTDFNRWLARRERMQVNAAFELKLVKGTSMPFDEVKEHQIRNLLLATNKLIYKIPDTGNSQKPFDCFQLCKAQAFVVIMFYERGQKNFYMIKAQTFDDEMKTSQRKSLTPERAKLIGVEYHIDR